MQLSETSLTEADIDVIVEALHGKKSGEGWLCQCPCHDDRTASLSIAVGDTQPIVWHCKAGCSQETVGKALRGILNKTFTPPPPHKTKAEIVPINLDIPTVTYNYYDESRTLIYQKLRYETIVDGNKQKTFRFRYKPNRMEEIWKWGRGTETPLLYCAPKLKRLQNVPVIICEGEKDCDRLNELFKDEFVAVTNDNGAGQWADELSAKLAGRKIYIAQDNDDAGIKRTKLLKKAFPNQILGVLAFTDEEVGPKGDVSDWLERGHTKEELLAKLKALQPPAKKKAAPEEALRDDYLDLIRVRFGDVKKDIFSDALLYKSKNGVWRPVENRLGVIRSDADELTRKGKTDFSVSRVKDHFDYLEYSLEAELIPVIPEWDGRDRLLEMAEQLQLNPEHCDRFFIKTEHIADVFKEWMANIFRKIDDPTMDKYGRLGTRTFIIVLQGPEKIGKDTWIRHLLCGLGQWFINFSPGANERDLMMQIHRGAVINITEFNKLNKFEPEFLKDICNRPSSDMRGSHDRREEIRESRSSFIASVNPIDILRDSHGNTRIIIFPLKGISFPREKSEEYSLQCLAQARALMSQEYVAPKESWAPLRALIEDGTPESPAEEAAEWWEGTVTEWLDYLRPRNEQKWRAIESNGWVARSDANDLLERGARAFKIPLRQFVQRLYAAGLQHRGGKDRTRALLLSRQNQPSDSAELPVEEDVTPNW